MSKVSAIIPIIMSRKGDIQPVKPSPEMMVGAKKPKALSELLVHQPGPGAEGRQYARHEEVAEGECPELPSADSPDEVGLVKVLVGPLGRKVAHAVDGKLAFVLREEFGGFGEIGEVEPDEDADNNGRCTFEDEAGV